MDKNLLDKYCGLMRYETHVMLQKCSLLSGFLSLVVLFPFLSAGFFPNKLWLCSIFSSLYCYLSCKYSFEDKAYEVKEVEKLYDEFINNYSKINEMFNLNDPMEIYKMFNYLLYKGYLSRNKSFNFSFKDVCDVGSIRGANVINGNGVCRHIAPMLKDIYNASGVESYVLPVYQRKWNTQVIFVDESLTLEEKDHIEKMLYEFKEYRELVDFFEIYYSGRVVVEKQFLESDSYERSCGNHVINMVIYKGQKCFVDPTQGRVYNYSLERSVLFDKYDDKIDICLSRFEEYNKKVSFERIRSKLLLPTLGYEGNLSSKIISMVDDNLDIFEKFYRENSSLYEEISDKLKNIRVRK